jgi:hypothetical protein
MRSSATCTVSAQKMALAHGRRVSRSEQSGSRLTGLEQRGGASRIVLAAPALPLVDRVIPKRSRPDRDEFCYRPLELPRFGGHLNASGRKPGLRRFRCRERGRRIRRSFVVRRSSWRCWATSRSASSRRIWASLTSRFGTGLKQERAERGERPDGLSGDEREELAQLRDENAKLRMEREILSKAAVPG